MQLTFQLFLLSDVFGNANNDMRLTRRAFTADKALITQPADLTIATDDAVLARFDGAGFQHLGKAFGGVFQIIGVDVVAPLVVAGQQQLGGAPEDALIGGADVDHPLGIPVKCPEHRVHTAK